MIAFVLALALLAQLPPVAKIPARHPRIAHFMPYLVGDSLRGLKRAKRLRFRYVDQNAHSDAQGLTWVLHWRKYRKQYRWIWTGRFVGKGRTRREQRRRVPKSWPQDFAQLTSAQVRLLRSRKIGGVRPYRARTHFALAHELGLKLCLEVKRSPHYLREPAWDNLAADRAATGAAVIIMTLQSQGGDDEALTRLTWARRKAFPVALLPRGERPADWFTAWQPLGIQVWGRWR